MNDLQTKLDRLADGELSRDEFAVLLSALDHEDEGWKKCALTFLESQALRSDLRLLVNEPPAPTKVSLPPTSERFGMWQWIEGIALAGCLGLAFWLGRGSMPSDDKLAIQPQPPKSGAVAREPWKQGRVTLVLNGADGRPREVDLPVVDGNYVDPNAFLARSAVIPPDVLTAIEQSGHKIERHREFMRQPVDAEHEVVVPVDHLRVVPVSHPMY